MATCKECLHYDACCKWTDFPKQCGIPVCARFNTADVVEVVRCKDCIFYMPMEGVEYKGKKAMHCFNHSCLVREDGFCDEGERKKQE